MGFNSSSSEITDSIGSLSISVEELILFSTGSDIYIIVDLLIDVSHLGGWKIK